MKPDLKTLQNSVYISVLVSVTNSVWDSVYKPRIFFDCNKGKEVHGDIIIINFSEMVGRVVSRSTMIKQSAKDIIDKINIKK